MNSFIISSLENLPQAAAEILQLAGQKNILAFYGPMGVGKTTLIKAICRAMGVEDWVNSPSFTLVNEYQSDSGRMVYHFDFYRIKKLEEAYDLGYDEYFYSSGLCLIEWPELIEELLPENTLRLYLRELPNGGREVNVLM